jgi:hypothetical protein
MYFFAKIGVFLLAWNWQVEAFHLKGLVKKLFKFLQDRENEKDSGCIRF